MQQNLKVCNIILSITIITGLLSGCHKINEIDNNNIISTPYALYFSDAAGSLYNTNNGTNFLLCRPYDQYPPRAIVTSGNNILWVKKNTHLSEDNGYQFNVTESSVIKNRNWKSIILDVPSQNRVYIASMLSNGVIYSEDHGKTWITDNKWDTSIKNFVAINSFAQLVNGDLFALQNDGNNYIYKRSNAADKWKGVNPVSPNKPLPRSYYFLTHFNNTLIACDTTGTYGVFYSNIPNGADWNAFTGLPTGEQIICANAPFDQILLVGTLKSGIFKLNNNTFEAKNHGLEIGTQINDIVGKVDNYKNGIIKKYIYLATSTGLYRSEDLGENWVRQKEGNYVRVN